ncbi:armadillo repeat-containing protein 7 isoform X1 [Nilaparvata lugens]|uniref:armadillo repeat-containing protein 7 isoform X1 n=1 Tax=Nilaparvata lugens TaxID=108931 RepID=UPI00193CB098|nr:armadillo repeat-containing protein 7 isoform X1 [Nilaparvata lugens]
MFSTFKSLKQRTSKNKPERQEFLKLLVNEFNTTPSQEMKQQTLANLANFAYDPINYGYLKENSIITVFLDTLNDDDPVLVRFAAAGLCNIVLDPETKEYVIANGGIEAVSRCLSSKDEQTVESSITTLMYLVTNESKPAITSPQIIQCMLLFADSPNPRLSILAKVFLEDYCSSEQIDAVKKSVQFIPLPNT